MTNTNNTIINMTPHPVTVGGVTIQPAQFSIRAASNSTVVGTINVQNVEVPITRMEFGSPVVINTQDNSEICSIPQWIEQNPNSVFIVSRIAAEAIRDNCGSDVSRLFLIPSDPIRDPEGRIIGVRGFSIV